MANAQSSTAPSDGNINRWLTTAASLVVGSAFFALWFWLLPQWLGFRVEIAGTARWRWVAAIPSVLGFAVALRCVWDFGWTGRGTPAPDRLDRNIVRRTARHISPNKFREPHSARVVRSGTSQIAVQHTPPIG